MPRTIVLVPLLAILAGTAAAQTPARHDTADAAVRAPVAVYDSAFTGYRPYVDPDLARWRAVNDEMARLGGHGGHVGHVGHVPGSAPSRAAPPAKPAAGDRK